MVICTGSIDAATIFTSYSMASVLPLLAPLQSFPKSCNWFRREMTDKWETSDRLSCLVSGSDKFRLTLFHATGDAVIPSSKTVKLFLVATATIEDRREIEGFDTRKKTIDVGEGSWIYS